MIEDVRAYHVKFGLLVHDTPVHLTRRKLAECANLMLGELMEFGSAAGLELNYSDGSGAFEFLVNENDHNADQDLEGQAGALVDLVYFALGTAVQLGLPWTKLWDDVHRANMGKDDKR